MKGIINLGWKYWAVEIGMVALAAYNFWLAALRWGFQDSDLTVSVGAVILAAATEIGLVVFLHMQRSAIYAEKRNASVLVWVALVAGCIAVSLYVNQLYFRAHWHDVDGNQMIDQWIRSGWPMVLMVGAALVPPKALRSVAEIQREYDVRVYEAGRKQELAQVQAQHKDDRRQRQAAERAQQAQMARIAGKELLAHYQTELDDDIVTDWVGLEQELRTLGTWPPSVAKLPTIDAQLSAALVADETMEEDDALTISGNHRAFISAREVAEVLSVSVEVAKQMMKAHSRHPFAIVGCKNIRLRQPVRGRDYERRAPYAAVLEVKTKLEAERRVKVRPLLRPQDEQEHTG